MPRTRIDDIEIGSRFRKDLGDLQELVESIQKNGLLEPVVITLEGGLIDGERRIAAFRLLGKEMIETTFATPENPVLAERDANVVRKALTASEATAIAAALEPIERAQAEARERAGVEPCGNLPQGAPGKSRDKVAAAVGMGERTLKKASEVVKAAKAEPEKYGDLQEQMDKTGKVDPAFKALKKRKEERLTSKPEDSPRFPRAPGQGFSEEARDVERVVGRFIKALERIRAEYGFCDETRQIIRRVVADYLKKHGG